MEVFVLKARVQHLKNTGMMYEPDDLKREFGLLGSGLRWFRSSRNSLSTADLISQEEVAVKMRREHFRMYVTFPADGRSIAKPRSDVLDCGLKIALGLGGAVDVLQFIERQCGSTVPAHVRNPSPLGVESSTWPKAICSRQPMAAT
jgi:hypothetical protein